MAIPDPLVHVDRAISELRRGAAVSVIGEQKHLLMVAAEALTPEQLEMLRHHQAGAAALVITGTRANVLGIDTTDRAVSRVSHPQGLTLDVIECLANPLAALMNHPNLDGLVVSDADDLAQAAITLCKLSRLLPAALIIEGSQAAPDTLVVKASEIQSYISNAAESLMQVSEAQVPLENAENARVVAFRPRDGGIEHLAIVVGDIDPAEPILVRLHSECFTGDLVGSLRCDCGNQLRGAITEMSRVGSGILLYLAQEGRGIGLVNKLRAYQLQDAGFDTVDANLQLGFDADERNYLPAAQMLRKLGVHRIKLLTNNPLKVAALARHDIEVVERISHTYPANKHNEEYLQTKAIKSGHLF
ncbi:GTP cyclohydrolase-2 [Polynucleobacter sp. TUM22923]|jgi:GTP cyclohydrolase II|uniref:GTP cyclohydrolase II n=1 Tax=Polynucleobacter sp. TUM22923 TaxID=3022126 RepID=UPI0025730B5C|nr:GTP cyclohydrolase II [Polynucleobacter sp. TUM22923]BDX22092.1 GTP cyclohydrolase-2 [Polynucleobacter sp. TUM22923]